MANPRGTTPIVYANKEEILNGANGGHDEGSRPTIPISPTRVEEAGMQIALVVVDVMPNMPTQPIQLFDGRQLFINAPQYYWHVTESIGGISIDQEARERIISLADLLDRFGHRTNSREEELWACTDYMAIATQVVEFHKPSEKRVSQLEYKVAFLENGLGAQRQMMEKIRVETNANITTHRQQLAALAYEMKIVEESAKLWDQL